MQNAQTTTKTHLLNLQTYNFCSNRTYISIAASTDERVQVCCSSTEMWPQVSLS